MKKVIQPRMKDYECSDDRRRFSGIDCVVAVLRLSTGHLLCESLCKCYVIGRMRRCKVA